MKANTPDNLDDFYESLPEPQRTAAIVLRELIFETLPELHEKKSWGVPFYFGQRAVCYLWPGSVTWGGKQQGEGVILGFNQATEFDHEGALSFGKRKKIGHITFRNAEDIDVELVIRLLRRARVADQAR